jgi:hypothetical protein
LPEPMRFHDGFSEPVDGHVLLARGTEAGAELRRAGNIRPADATMAGLMLDQRHALQTKRVAVRSRASRRASLLIASEPRYSRAIQVV